MKKILNSIIGTIKANIELSAIIAIGVVSRLIAWPFAQNVDADSVSRIFIAKNLLANPEIITHGVWAPLHFYFTALGLLICPNDVVGPQLMHILIAVFTALPLYKFTKNEFNKEGALAVALIYVLLPISFRNSFHALSSQPHAFFVAMTMMYISKGVRTKQWNMNALYAGVFMTIAAGFRYEAWVLIVLFSIVIAMFRNPKFLLGFFLVSMIFPALWMLGNHLYYGDFLYSIHGADVWNMGHEGVNDNITLELINKRLIFFPFSLVFVLTPFVAIIIIWQLWNRFYNGKLTKDSINWLIPFVGILCAFMLKSLNGSLLNQHRFTVLPTLLILPFLALWFGNEVNRFKRIVILSIAFTLIPLSFVYANMPVWKLRKISLSLSEKVEAFYGESIHQTEAIPRIKDDKINDILEVISTNSTENTALILDFIGWDRTYFIALKTDGDDSNIYIVDGSKHGTLSKEKFTGIAEKCREGIFLIRKYSDLHTSSHIYKDLLIFDGIPLFFKVEELYSNSELILYKFYLKSEDWAIQYKVNDRILFEPVAHSVEYYEAKIKQNQNWLNDVKRKASERGVSVDEMVKLDAQWMLDNENK